MRPGFKKQVINEWVLREQADRVLKQLSMDLDLNKRVERLTTMERIMVEIAKAYLMGSKLLVVLYPEKLIGQADFPQFHQLLRKMQSMGISTLYFCYHHWIMFKICDRIALFSRGRIKKLFEPEEFREEAIAPYIYYFKENTVFKPKVDRGYIADPHPVGRRDRPRITDPQIIKLIDIRHVFLEAVYIFITCLFSW